MATLPGSSGDCRIAFFDTNTCTSEIGSSNEFGAPSDANSWVPASGDGTSPPVTAGIRLICAGFAGYGYYDQFYLGISIGTF